MSITCCQSSGDHLLDGPVAEDAGVVDDDVQAAESADGLVDHPLDGGHVAHVGLDHRHAVRGHLGRRLLGAGAIDALRVVEVVDDDVGAGLVQSQGRGAPQALPRAGDHRRFAGKIDGNHGCLVLGRDCLVGCNGQSTC